MNDDDGDDEDAEGDDTKMGCGGLETLLVIEGDFDDRGEAALTNEVDDEALDGRGYVCN